MRVEQPGILRQLGHGFGDHGAQKIGGVEQAVHAAPDRVPTGGQIQRAANARHAVDQGASRLALHRRPQHQGIAPE